MKRTLVDASMQICALFVFGRNALDMKKFGLDFRARPSKWRQITSVMGQGVYVCMCVCVCARARVYECVSFICAVLLLISGHSTLIVVRHN